MRAIPTAVCLTTYRGDEKDFARTPLEETVKQIKEGKTKVQVGKTFALDGIVEAYRTMERTGRVTKLCCSCELSCCLFVVNNSTSSQFP